MSKEELKKEINKVLDGFNNDALEEVLYFLKSLDAKALLNNIHLEKILKEDNNLLKKLAQ